MRIYGENVLKHLVFFKPKTLPQFLIGGSYLHISYARNTIENDFNRNEVFSKLLN